MKTSLSHLPDDRRAHINHCVQVIINYLKPNRIFLFGSYTSEKWEKDEELGKGINYRADIDLVIIMNTESQITAKDIDKMMGRNIPLKINCLFQSELELEKALFAGNFFFLELQREAILLHDSEITTIPIAKRKLALETAEFLKMNYTHHYYRGRSWYEVAKLCLNSNHLILATYQLREVSETIYSAILLVFQGYIQPNCKIQYFYRLTKQYSIRLAAVFPQNNKDEKHLFMLLQKSSTVGKYEKGSMITKHGVVILFNRIKELISIAEEICMYKITATLHSNR